MTNTGRRAAQVALFIAAGCGWSAAAVAQFVPAPSVPAGTTSGNAQSIQQRLYPGVATGGILTTREDRTSVTLGSDAAAPAIGPLPHAIATPESGAAYRDLVRGSLRGTARGDAPSGVQGLYTAPAEQDPLGRITP